MTIECYKASCIKHRCHYDKDSGPFCDEIECIDQPLYRPPPDPITLTCYNCKQRDTCKYVDDPYNTDGDCLMDK